MPFSLVRRIGSSGPGGSHYQEALRAVAVSAGDDGGSPRIFMAGDSSVAVFGLDGQLLSGWDTARPGHAIAVASSGLVFVGEAGQVEIFHPAGTLVTTWIEPEKLGLVTAVGFLGTDVLCADARARCIRRFDAHGSHLNDIGHDSRRRGFTIPNGVLDFAVDADGILHVANPGMHRIQRYTPEGELLGHFGRFDGLDPEGFGGCCNPTNIALTQEGNIVVSEKAEPRVKMYDPSGTLLAVVASDVFDLGCKNMDIATDAQGRLYVVDTVSLDVLIFQERDRG